MLEEVILVLVHSIGALPIRARSSLGRLIGFLVSYVPNRNVAIAKAQISKFLPETDPNRILVETFKNISQTAMESFNLSPILNRRDELIKCESWQIAEKALRNPMGVVCLTAHLGNWDLLGAYVVARGVPLLAVGREARNKTMHNVLKRLRARSGLSIIWRSNRNGIKQIIQALEQGKCVAALVDQDTRVKSSFAPFFGLPARTPNTLVELGLKVGSDVLCAFIVRTSSLHHEVFIYNLPKELGTEAILEHYNHALENLIRRFPAQWVWFHKRWRSTIDGRTLRTEEYLNFLKGADPCQKVD